MNKSYPEAMEYLLGGSGMGTLTTAPPVVREQKPFELPPKNDNNRRAYAYLLNKRGINREVLNVFFYTGLIYESADYHNAVFVGKNPEGIAVHAHKRGTGSESTFKGNVDSSDPRYSFHWIGRSNRVYLFEAPIDMLSFYFTSQKRAGRSTAMLPLRCIRSGVVADTCRSSAGGYGVPLPRQRRGRTESRRPYCE